MTTWESWPRDFCFYCLIEIADLGSIRRFGVRRRTKDHVVPQSWRGRIKIAPHLRGRNVVPCCDTCNRTKSNIHPLIWLKALPTEEAQERLREVLVSMNLWGVLYEPPATDDHAAELERLARYWSKQSCGTQQPRVAAYPVTQEQNNE